MRACVHYARRQLGDETEILRTGDHPWNAWVVVYSKEGKVVYSSFEVGLRWEYLEHLLISPACRKQAGLSWTELLNLIAEVKKEWEAAVGE